jgi:hypothetical protein
VTGFLNGYVLNIAGVYMGHHHAESLNDMSSVSSRIYMRRHDTGILNRMSSVSPLLRIPQDVGLCIIEAAVNTAVSESKDWTDDALENDFPPLSPVFALSATCKFLRAFTLCHPHIWTKVFVRDGRGYSVVDVLNAHADRSEGRPLEVMLLCREMGERRLFTAWYVTDWVLFSDGSLFNALARISHRCTRVVLALPHSTASRNCVEFGHAADIHCVCPGSNTCNEFFLSGNRVRSLRLSGVTAISSREDNQWGAATVSERDPWKEERPWKGITTLDMARVDGHTVATIARLCDQLEYLTVRVSSTGPSMHSWGPFKLRKVHTFVIISEGSPDACQINAVTNLFSLERLLHLAMPTIPCGPSVNAIAMLQGVESVDLAVYDENDLEGYLEPIPKGVSVRVRSMERPLSYEAERAVRGRFPSAVLS